jgi:hypothetical protein
VGKEHEGRQPRGGPSASFPVYRLFRLSHPLDHVLGAFHGPAAAAKQKTTRLPDFPPLRYPDSVSGIDQGVVAREYIVVRCGRRCCLPASDLQLFPAFRTPYGGTTIMEVETVFVGDELEIGGRVRLTILGAWKDGVMLTVAECEPPPQDEWWLAAYQSHD